MCFLCDLDKRNLERDVRCVHCPEKYSMIKIQDNSSYVFYRCDLCGYAFRKDKE
jgi:DNA-directed RNA polymerase subunit M/transcription elongation factor TFIIS